MPLWIQLQEREDFEVRTLRALGGGALAGLAMVAARRLGVHLEPAYFGVLGAALAGARVDWKRRLGLLVGLPLLLCVPLVLNLPSTLEKVCIGALAAAAVAGLGTAWRPRPLQVLAGALGAGALLPLGLYVKTVMDARLFDGRLEPLGALVGLTTVALFWSVGLLATHVRVHASAVEARGTSLETQLAGEAQGLVTRARVLYQQCQKETQRLTAGPGRSELQGVLEKMAREVFSLAETHAGLEAQLHAVQQGNVDAQVQELRAKAAATTDAVARRQLELAASSLGEELNHLDLLERKRERLMAQLHAQVALLERARVSLVGVRGGDVASKSAQAAELARKLASLGQEEPGAAQLTAPRPEATKLPG